MEELTDKQRNVLEFITEFFRDNGMPPTLREISAYIGTKGTVSALRHIEALERKGFINRREGSSRGIILKWNSREREDIFNSSSERSGSRTVQIPVAGTVKAGVPSMAIEDIDGYIETDISWLKGDGCFYLKVSGDSMTDAHILDGDLALIKPQNYADNGEIVVAMRNDEATLKRFFRENGRIVLKPENSSMRPVIINEGEAEVVIIGKLLKLVRSFE